MSEFTRVAVADWDRLRETLGAFDATVAADDEEIELTSGNARFRIDRDGRVDAGMPLHAFDGSVAALELDPTDGRIRITGDVEYVFRVP